MGNNPSQQILDDLSSTIKRGDLAGVQAFLQRLALARDSAAPRQEDAKTQAALRGLDLNCVIKAQELTPLQVAASCGHAAIVRLLLEAPLQDHRLPAVDPDARNDKQQTALHLASRDASQIECLLELLARKADPYIASNDGLTPLDVARRARCLSSVRAIEGVVSCWQGWVDHDEHRMLQLPNWKARWLCVLVDRRPNTGHWAGSTNLSCFSCGRILKVPPYVFKVDCPTCGACVAMTPSFQLALYENYAANSVGHRTASGLAQGGFGAASAPNNPVPVQLIILPQVPSQLAAKQLEDSTTKHIFEGSFRKAWQSAVPSQRQKGLNLKVYSENRTIEEEHSFRVESEAERQKLIQILQNPSQAYHESLTTASTAPTVAFAMPSASGHMPAAVPGPRTVVTGEPLTGVVPTSAQALASRPTQQLPVSAPTVATTGACIQPLSWDCPKCTYHHSGGEALLLACAICGSPRVSAPDGLAAEHTVTTQPPPVVEVEATAPPASGALASSTPAAAGASNEAAEEANEEEEMCVVCLERKADTAVVPCGHMCGCQKCLQALRGRPDAECPLCRGPLESIIRIYRN